MTKRLSCPDCGAGNVRTDYIHGEIVCNVCGFVVQDSLIDPGPEWRAFDDEQRNKRERTGGIIRFAKLNKGLTTEIDRYDRDIRGGSIEPEKRLQIFRLRKWQKRIRMSSSVQRNLSIALPELDRMCSCLEISTNLKEEAAILYRRVVKRGLVRGRAIECVLAAILYYVSKKHHTPKTLEELEKVAGVRKKDIGRAYRYLCRKLGLRMPLSTPIDYVPRFTAELKLSGRTEALAVKILEKASKHGLISGRGPAGVAAAAVFLATKLTSSVIEDEERFRKTFSRLIGVTEVTIRNRCEELAKVLELA